MSEQETHRPKTLATLFTIVRPLPRVDTDVCHESGLLSERLGTVGALEGLLTRVEPAVSLQM